ncbi:hypothetical protein X801_08331 [Opisthorchis viverrini]|uniref:Tetratricopeptide repeat protein n=1 Tax=Opisthorchis viverrini TaxID=6198 RepID=A0A1S8WN09_OPIVI|nr:hypothetical protein X801_08331 [Opisthorchis viverrini]
MLLRLHMSVIFLKFNETERALDILQRLSNSGFSTSGNLQAEIGLAYDGLRDMDMASRQFEQLFSQFPCRLDNVDAYSNVLFVREDSIELAHLAHHCVSLDKYRPETCCVVTNTLNCGIPRPLFTHTDKLSLTTDTSFVPGTVLVRCMKFWISHLLRCTTIVPDLAGRRLFCAETTARIWDIPSTGPKT